MAEESLSGRLADTCCEAGHGLGEVIQPCGGYDQGPLGQHVDCGAEPCLRTGERGAFERLDHPVGIRVADEPQRDVPVLRGDEANSTLVLAVQAGQLGDHVLGRPHRDEQPCHAQQSSVANARALRVLDQLGLTRL